MTFMKNKGCIIENCKSFKLLALKGVTCAECEKGFKPSTNGSVCI